MTTPTAPTPTELVESFAGSDRFGTYLALQQHGSDALTAVHAGLAHENWHVRHWCAIYLDRNGTPESLPLLLPLLQDPKHKVRVWAVHTLSCQHCHTENPVDFVPLLIDRIEHDPDDQVRRMATAMLADAPDDRAIPILERLVADESDRRIVLHARDGLQRLEQERDDV